MFVAAGAGALFLLPFGRPRFLGACRSASPSPDTIAAVGTCQLLDAQDRLFDRCFFLP